jgi:branched-chain amino acid transport system ATP-binding protein
MLEVRGLDVSYGEAQALWEVDLSVGDGEVVCIVGPNGAGKTTLVQAIAGMLPIARGSVSIGGADVAGQPAHVVCRSGVAIVPEGRRIFPSLTVRDNLDLGAYRHDARASHAESLAWVHGLFPRLAERFDQLAGSLSGGEQQMLAIGRALVTNPHLLILDEATEGLAPLVREEIWKCLERLRAAGQTILVIDKYVERLVKLADRHTIIERGRVAWQGTSAALDADRGLWHRYLGI